MGALAYWLKGITKLSELSSYEVRIVIDDRVLEGPYLGLIVANGCCAGGGFMIASDALLNDGLLDVTVIPVFSTMLELLAASASFALGATVEGLETYRARKVSITTLSDMPFSVDGELVESIDGVVEIIPRALRVVVGEKARLAEVREGQATSDQR